MRAFISISIGVAFLALVACSSSDSSSGSGTGGAGGTQDTCQNIKCTATTQCVYLNNGPICAELCPEAGTCADGAACSCASTCPGCKSCLSICAP